MGPLILLVGVGLFLLGGLMLLFQIFSDSVLWGLLCVFISPLGFVWLVMNWGKGSKPFFVQAAGFALAVIGKAMAA